MRVRFRRVAAVLIGVVLGVTVLPASPAGAVYRGRDANFDQYRFMVSLRLASTPDGPRCGGTLIEPDIVLTAAHCVVLVPQGGLVAVVGADIPDWPTAPRIATLGHRIPQTFDIRIDNRDDIAVLRLADPQSSPAVALAAAEPSVREHVLIAGFGCVNAPPVCEVMASRLQISRQAVLDDASCGINVFANPPLWGPTTICTKGVRHRSTVNRGDSGGPLLIPGRHGFRQVGVTSLGSDSTTKLYAGFTSIPIEADWIAAAIESLRTG